MMKAGLVIGVVMLGNDIIANKIINTLIDKGVDELKNNLIESDRRKMLCKACESFVEMSSGSSEYPGMVYLKDGYDLSKLNENDLNPAKSVDDLSEILAVYVENTFKIEGDIEWKRLAKCIALYYKKRALVTCKLKDLAEELNTIDESIDKGLDTIQAMLTESKKKEQANEARKKRIFEQYIQNRVNDLVSVLSNVTYHLVFKSGHSHKNNENPVVSSLNSMKQMIKDNDERLYDTDYWRKPVDIITGPDETLYPVHKQILPGEFIEMYKIQVDSLITEVLRFESVLPESLFYAILELDLSIRNDIVMKYISQMKMVNQNTKHQAEDIHGMLVGWCNRALEIGKYYKP